MAKYIAPAHVSSVFLSCGECAVVDGVVELPDDLSDGDLIGLAGNGFVPVSDIPAADSNTAATGLETNDGGTSDVVEA